MKLQFSSLKDFKAFLAMQALGSAPVFAGNVNNCLESDASQVCAEIVSHIAYYKRKATKLSHRVTGVTILLSDYKSPFGSNGYRLDVVVRTEPKV